MHRIEPVFRTWWAGALIAVAMAPAVRADAAAASPAKGPAVVRVVNVEGGYQLLRDGKPYVIKGAGGDGSPAALAEAGGNSLRTWGVDHATEVLDRAHSLGLTVSLGIWLGHERHGFDYNDPAQVAAQYEQVRRTILLYKDHPALLMWGLGNEMEGAGDNAAIWSAVNNLASLAKTLDPNHPVMTVVAEIGGEKVRNLHRLCPAIDVVGINSYAGLASIPARYKAAGGVKPYVITEFGPPGTWESKKNAWGVVPELTSTEKAAFYRRGYEQAIAALKGICLGSYAFLWGQKQEATATWFGLLLPDGTRLAAVDALSELWTGKPPANRCPTIARLALEGPDQVDPGATVRATLDASDPEGDGLAVRWALRREPSHYSTGGDREEAPPDLPGAIVRSDARQATVTLPKGGGGYRLFAYVRDGRGGGAVANVPLLVKGPIASPTARRAALPLVVYDEAGRERLPYVPTGWMGNVKALKLDESCALNPHAGKTCLRVDYRLGDGWAGVVWQDPPNDWGNQPGGWDLSGARRLSFWARGASGGETVSFEFGLFGKDKPFPDTARGKLERVALTTAWQQFSIAIPPGDLSRIKSGFVFTIAAAGAPITLFLDDITYE